MLPEKKWENHADTVDISRQLSDAQQNQHRWTKSIAPLACTSNYKVVEDLSQEASDSPITADLNEALHVGEAKGKKSIVFTLIRKGRISSYQGYLWLRCFAIRSYVL